MKKSKSTKKAWYVYILKCADGTFYTGITKNIANRLNAHNSGKGARYTRTRRPVTLIYKEKQPDVGSALKRERKIKALPRVKKAGLKGKIRSALKKHHHPPKKKNRKSK